MDGLQGRILPVSVQRIGVACMGRAKKTCLQLNCSWSDLMFGVQLHWNPAGNLRFD